MVSPDSVLIALPDQDEVPVQTHARDKKYKSMMVSPDSVLESALPDQNEVPLGNALKIGSRSDEDEDDSSCRTDMTTLRASNRQRCTTVRNQDMRSPSVECFYCVCSVGVLFVSNRPVGVLSVGVLRTPALQRLITFRATFKPTLPCSHNSIPSHLLFSQSASAMNQNGTIV
jgi:hypothetical protein